ncbi:restriction endonuclease subunit S [Pseudodesulfovibrio indicus]|uniref:restriction endonuclease subunit S n=1 Tax=Pseudodesulfovibrio indicus TaxID=1716143 RepID=UPI002D1E4845|nr:restriction endonuclease subunit S [Pseudodesulfovibrio indicus]
MEHIEPHSFELVGSGRFSEMKSAGVHFDAGDILYGRLRPYLNKVHKAASEGACSAEFIVLPFPQGVDSDFMRYLLHSRELVSYASHPDNVTGDRPRINFETLAKFKFSLPPTSEQSRIVSKIEELFSDLNKGEENLRRVQALIGRYRQSVLKAAVTGELTRDWREQQKGSIETGEQLLKRILKARRAAWEEAERAKMQAKGEKPKSDKWKERYKEPVGPDTSELPELPDGWVWATVEQLASGEPRSIQSGPFGSNLLHSEFQKTGILAIGIDNVQEGKFSPGSQNRISEPKYQELEKYTARPLDFVITVMATVGRCAVLPEDLERAIITKHVYRVSTNTDLFNPHFMMWCFLGDPAVKTQVQKETRGQTRPGINGAILKEIAIPLPPLEEQTQLVDKVQNMVEMVSRVLEQIGHGTKYSQATRQSILKAAFSGELVPQDPNDEPATELMKRIAEQKSRADAAKPPRGATRKTPASKGNKTPGKLAQARKKAGLSQAKLAQATGINQAYLSQMENGRRPITPEQGQKLAGVLGVPGEDLT